jgi:hypothetical protein
VGTNGHTLVADSATATGLKWAAPASSSGPAFRAQSTSAQSFSAATWTKVTLGTETYDTDSCFASSTFTPNKAGYYQFNVSMNFTPSTASTNNFTAFYKNGTGWMIPGFEAANFELEVGYSGSDLVYMDGSTDTMEIYVFRNAGTGTVGCTFSGVWIRS